MGCLSLVSVGGIAGLICCGGLLDVFCSDWPGERRPVKDKGLVFFGRGSFLSHRYLCASLTMGVRIGEGRCLLAKHVSAPCRVFCDALLVPDGRHGDRHRMFDSIMSCAEMMSVLSGPGIQRKEGL